jgi:hypothetical protein
MVRHGFYNSAEEMETTVLRTGVPAGSHWNCVDIHDNRPQNLEVLPSQAVHASIHGQHRHEGK